MKEQCCYVYKGKS